ncbi:MAG: sel1 repeat family protein, partial [Prevotella sp.]|nr:sel1 repeat family protein [Prevotella sp.]
TNRLTGFRESSFKLIESKAFGGDPRWQFILGQMYRWAEQYFLVEQDFTKAAYWWNEAASKNYARAYNNLGIAYKRGEGVKVDLRKAVEYLKKGAEAGDEWAQRNYGDLFMEGVKIKVGSHKQLKPGYNPAIYDKYDLYAWQDIPEYGIIIPKDIEQAKYWWKKSAAQGNEMAKDRLQKIY